MRIKNIVYVIILIAAIAVPAMASEITINEGQNEVMFKYQGFSSGDQWTVKLYTNSTKSELRYDFSGIIDNISSQNDWYIWLSSLGHESENGIRKCAYAGSYYAVATGTHSGMTYSQESGITIDPKNVCTPTIDPVPELNPLILTSAGLIGLLLISRKYKK